MTISNLPAINSTADAANLTADQLAQKLLAGKYKSEKELEQGYLSQMTETNKIIAERDNLKQKYEALVSLMDPMKPNNGDGRTEQAPLSSVKKLAEAMNVSEDLLLEALQEVTETQVDTKLDAKLSPLSRGMAWRSEFLQQTPEFAKFEPEIGQFLAANPDVAADFNERVNSSKTKLNPYRVLWNEFRASRAQKPREGDASGTDALNAKLDAQLLGSSGGNTAPGERDRLSQIAEIEKALREGRISKDAAFAALVRPQLQRENPEAR